LHAFQSKILAHWWTILGIAGSWIETPTGCWWRASFNNTIDLPRWKGVLFIFIYLSPKKVQVYVKWRIWISFSYQQLTIVWLENFETHVWTKVSCRFWRFQTATVGNRLWDDALWATPSCAGLDSIGHGRQGQMGINSLPHELLHICKGRSTSISPTRISLLHRNALSANSRSPVDFTPINFPQYHVPQMTLTQFLPNCGLFFFFFLAAKHQAHW
jgi:hypothetical protein